MEAGSIALPATVNGQTSFPSQSFSTPFSATPLVFVLPSKEGSAPCDIRVRSVTTGGALSSTETIGWLAITSTTDSWFVAAGPEPVRLDAFITSDTITGWDNTGGSGNPIGLAPDFPAPPLIIGNLAKRDGSANNTWENVDGVAAFDWGLASNSRVPVADGLTPPISEAYQMPAARATMQTLEKLSNNPTDEDASFELWFRPTTFSTSSPQVLFETGGNLHGTAIVLDGDELKFVTQDGAAKRIMLSTTLSSKHQGRFNQVVGVIDRTKQHHRLALLERHPRGHGKQHGE